MRVGTAFGDMLSHAPFIGAWYARRRNRRRARRADRDAKLDLLIGQNASLQRQLDALASAVALVRIEVRANRDGGDENRVRP